MPSAGAGQMVHAVILQESGAVGTCQQECGCLPVVCSAPKHNGKGSGSARGEETC